MNMPTCPTWRTGLLCVPNHACGRMIEEREFCPSAYISFQAFASCLGLEVEQSPPISATCCPLTLHLHMTTKRSLSSLFSIVSSDLHVVACQICIHSLPLAPQLWTHISTASMSCCTPCPAVSSSSVLSETAHIPFPSFLLISPAYIGAIILTGTETPN